MKYQPEECLTLIGAQARRQWQGGSLTGAVASERVTEAFKGWLRRNGNPPQSAKAQASLTARATPRAETKVGLSDPTASAWKGRGLSDKSYPGDNRLVWSKSSHRRPGSAPRCRLIASWGWTRSQGLGCSPIKAVRELGSDRRETGRSLSAVGVWAFDGNCP